MNINKRYKFGRVFWVILSIYVFFTALGIITISMLPSATKAVQVEKIWSLRSIISQVVSLSFSTLFYYFMLNGIYRLYAERKSVSFFLKPLAFAVIALVAYNLFSYLFLNEKNFVSVNNSEKREEVPVVFLFISYIISTAFYLGIALLVPYLTYLRDERMQRKVLEEQKMQLEVEKSQANFNFLKAQINPHFLHNTLNFLYAKSLPYSPELSEGILTLSDIMRYALSEGNARNGKALLKEEIEHLRNVIKINQLRFSNNLRVQLDVEGVINGAEIIPFVLITLVENAFKHGDLKSTEHPIVIRIVIVGKKLYFYCRNKKKTGPKELSTGIGLDNIKKRLELAYGTHYAFKVRDEAEFYTTELTIDPL
jgi:sensor histidine kinase YesM